jgi:hypothetical protein
MNGLIHFVALLRVGAWLEEVGNRGCTFEGWILSPAPSSSSIGLCFLAAMGRAALVHLRFLPWCSGSQQRNRNLKSLKGWGKQTFPPWVVSVRCVPQWPDSHGAEVLLAQASQWSGSGSTLWSLQLMHVLRRHYCKLWCSRLTLAHPLSLLSLLLPFFPQMLARPGIQLCSSLRSKAWSPVLTAQHTWTGKHKKSLSPVSLWSQWHKAAGHLYVVVVHVGLSVSHSLVTGRDHLCPQEALVKKYLGTILGRSMCHSWVEIFHCQLLSRSHKCGQQYPWLEEVSRVNSDSLQKRFSVALFAA